VSRNQLVVECGGGRLREYITIMIANTDTVSADIIVYI